MDRLNRLLVSTPSEFAAAFDAAGDDCRTDATQTTAAFWLEGGITQAGAGFVWGKGEMSYRGCNHAFRLSGLSIADVDAANICANADLGREGLDGIPAAPDRYRGLLERAKMFLKPDKLALAPRSRVKIRDFGFSEAA